MRLVSLIILVCLCVPAQAKLGDRLKKILHHEPTQVIQQDQRPEAQRPTRSLLTPRGRSASPQTPAPSHTAPRAPDDEPKTSAKPTAGLSSDESRMVAAINQYRAGYKLAPLSADPLLEQVARQRVGVFSHNQPRFGGYVWQHAHRLGFPGPAFNTTCTDDLCQGAPTPEEAVSGWAHSTVGHAEQMRGKANMNDKWQDCHFNLCGVAHQGQNYIAVFGRREDAVSDSKKCQCQSGGVCTCGPNCKCGKGK